MPSILQLKLQAVLMFTFKAIRIAKFVNHADSLHGTLPQNSNGDSRPPYV